MINFSHLGILTLEGYTLIFLIFSINRSLSSRFFAFVSFDFNFLILFRLRRRRFNFLSFSRPLPILLSHSFSVCFSMKPGDFYGYRPKYGANFLIRHFRPGVSTSSILWYCLLARFDLRRRRWPWWPLVRKILPLPVIRNRFAVALCVFNLYLPFFFLRGTISTSLWLWNIYSHFYLICLGCIFSRLLSLTSGVFTSQVFPLLMSNYRVMCE